MSKERIRMGVLWNALNEATDLLCYYVTADSDKSEATYHAAKIDMFDRILWEDRKNMPQEDRAKRKYLDASLKENSKKGLLDDPQR